jgi:hypothetical protein
VGVVKAINGSGYSDARTRCFTLNIEAYAWICAASPVYPGLLSRQAIFLCGKLKYRELKVCFGINIPSTLEVGINVQSAA